MTSSLYFRAVLNCNLALVDQICHVLGNVGVTLEKITPTRTDKNEYFFTFSKRRQSNSLLF